MNIPKAVSTLPPVEPCFATPNGEPFLSYGLGPTSRVIGATGRLHGNSGMSFGLFSSQWLNQKDICLNCVASAQNLVEIAPSYTPCPTNAAFAAPLPVSPRGILSGIPGWPGVAR